MIVAKTKLKKIPEGCAKCTYSSPCVKTSEVRYCRLCNCYITKTFVEEKNNWMYVIPNKCPLMEVEFINE